MKKKLIFGAIITSVLLLAMIISCKDEQPVEPTKIKLTDIISEVSINQSYGEYFDGEPPSSNSNTIPVIAGTNEIVQGGSLILRVQPSDSAKKIIISLRKTGLDYLSLSFGEIEPGYFVINLEDFYKQEQTFKSINETIKPKKKNSKINNPLKSSENYHLSNDLETYLLVISFSNTETINNFVIDIASGIDEQISEFASHDVTVNSQASSSNTLQVSLNWVDLVDIDLHVETPNGNDIYYGEPIGQNGGSLDLDSNPACEYDYVNNENITWFSNEPAKGLYIVRADLWSACEKNHSFPFVASVRLKGKTEIFSGNFFPSDETFGDAYSGRIITTFYVDDENYLLSVKGINSSGSSELEIQIPDEKVVNNAQLFLNESLINEMAGSFSNILKIPFNQNDLNYQLVNNFVLKLNTSNSELIELPFFATPQKCNSSTEDNLWFQFTREGYPLIPIAFPTHLSIVYIKHVYSIPSSGYLNQVIKNYSNDNSVNIGINLPPIIEGLNDQCDISGTVTWSPNSLISYITTPPRLPVISPRDISFSSEPTQNWWFIVNQGKINVKFSIQVSSTAGTTPGIPINDNIELNY
jgi:hypothetical protein